MKVQGLFQNYYEGGGNCCGGWHACFPSTSIVYRKANMHMYIMGVGMVGAGGAMPPTPTPILGQSKPLHFHQAK